MIQKLTLNDGTELDNSSAIEEGNTLFLYVYAEITFADLFALLNDPEKAKKVVETLGEKKTTYRNFKELYFIRKENGFISAGLRK